MDSRAHYHWTFVAFNRDAENKAIDESIVETVVIGWMTESDARVALKDLVSREVYVLRRIYECNTCAFQETIGESMDKIASDQ